MKLKCGVHAEQESETRPIFICHHCGIPVCEEHGWVVLADDAFSGVEEPVPTAAMHCPECVAAFHPRGASKRRGWIVRRPRAADQGSPAAPQPPAPQPHSPAPQPQAPHPSPEHQPAGPYPQQPAR